MKTTQEKILHIDDDEANRYAVKLILERAGYEVLEAENGHKGLLLAEDKPDLIILDIRLPDIDGYEVCRVIKSREHLSSIPVLQTSATFVTSEDKVEGLESGADGYLSQPIDNAVLVATVRSLLRIKAAEKTAREAKRAQEEILAIVSHDLRNPLSVVMLQTKLLTKGLQKKDDEKVIVNHIDRIHKSCARMNKLIEDLLIVSNIENGKLTLVRERFQVDDLIDEVALSFEDLASQKQVRLRKNTRRTDDHSVFADRDRIIQVYSNLISNALRFTALGGVIELGVNMSERSCVFHVSDSGVGIPSESLPHIFDRYWQGHKDRSTGVGLGLSIVKGIVEAHEGSVWAESELGKGTSFFFMIPR